MNRLFKIGLLALAGGAAASGVGFLAYSIIKKREEGEPAAPGALVPATGGSGILPSDNEIEALARVIASEAGSGTDAEKKAIGWTVRNRFRNKSIYSSEYPWRSQKGSDPPFASARPATDATRTLARQILAADQSADPTGGATSFFEPRMQDAFAKAGALARAGETGDRTIDGVKLTDITRFKNYKKSAQQIRDSWGNGSTVYANAGRFEFWGSAKLFAQRGGSVQTVAGVIEGRTSEDYEALARAVESNLGGRSRAEMAAAAWSMRNRAIDEGKSVYQMLAPNGVYGAPSKSGGYASTRRLPNELALEVAYEVLDSDVAFDPTDGAIDYWVPEQQARMRTLGDVYRAARRMGDLRKVRKYERYAGYGSEGEARRLLARQGLATTSVIGAVELLKRVSA